MKDSRRGAGGAQMNGQWSNGGAQSGSNGRDRRYGSGHPPPVKQKTFPQNGKFRFFLYTCLDYIIFFRIWIGIFKIIFDYILLNSKKRV